MKHTILGFQQTKLIEAQLDVVDALILRMIKDLYSSSTMEFITEGDTKYMWINYSYMFEQLPILGTKRNLMRRIEKYGNELYILRILKHVKNGKKGNFSYIAPTEKLDMLQDFDLMTKSHKGYDTNDIRVMTKSHNKDTSFKDSSIKDNKDNVYIEFFEKMWKLYPNKKGKGQVSDSKKKELYKHKDELENCIKRYLKYRDSNSDWLKLQNGSTFFNSGYVDYLDENYTEQSKPQDNNPYSGMRRC